jgi:hypothetical protein
VNQTATAAESRVVTAGQPSATESVGIFAVGFRPRFATPGQTVSDTLREAGIVLPSRQQTVRRNGEEISDLEQVLQAGDQVTIVHRVSAGGMG